MITVSIGPDYIAKQTPHDLWRHDMDKQWRKRRLFIFSKEVLPKCNAVFLNPGRTQERFSLHQAQEIRHLFAGRVRWVF
jgi:hypothetical protein